jgi:hypothetical protein
MKKIRFFIKISMTHPTIVNGHDFALSISDEITNQSFDKLPPNHQIFFDGNLYMYSDYTQQYIKLNSIFNDGLNEGPLDMYILKLRLKKLDKI